MRPSIGEVDASRAKIFAEKVSENLDNNAMSTLSSIGGPPGDVTRAGLPDLQGTGVAIDGRSEAVSTAAPFDVQLSPLAQVTSTLEELQGADPIKFREVAEQIAANLQADAHTAESEGETTTANWLNQIASAFTTASQSGKLPNLQDLLAITAV